VGVDQEIPLDPLRRLAGVSPSYADGVLICPTAHRSIVAVELATRSLLWGYTYAGADLRSRQQMAFFGFVRPELDTDFNERWTDSSVVLADGRVLVTPPDSAYLYCLDLFAGECLWQEPRRENSHDDLYLACAYKDKAILVGREQVRALSLGETREDERLRITRPVSAWDGRVVEFPPRSSPSGLGFLSDNLYYVPLSNAEVLAVDLDTGCVARVVKSRRGNVPGNLVCHNQNVLSQGAGFLEAFYQLDSLDRQVNERLAVEPDDAEALALRGEILWNQGELERAVESIRRSLELQPTPNARELLRDALLDGLRNEFAAYRNDSDELERLIDEPKQKATYLRLMATGLENVGEYREALVRYLELIDLDRRNRDMEQVAPSHLVRRDRWIQLQLAALFDAASADVRAEINEAVKARLAAARTEGTPDALARFLEYFGTHQTADRARRELARQLADSGRPIG